MLDLSLDIGFSDFPIQFVDAMCSIVPNVRLKFKAVIPKPLQDARLNGLPTGTFLYFLHLSFNNIQLLGE